MHHFFVEAHQVENGSVRILGGDVNHMKNVLRMRAGEEVAVSDGAGQTYLCQVESFEEDAVCLKILEHQAADAELPSRLILFQCLPKGDKMDLIVQKAVELGVAGIVPVSSRRCVVKLDQKKEESKRKRWQAIAESAAKQSGRGVVPKVHPLCGFQKALKLAGELDVRLIPYECAEDLLGDGTESAMEKTRKVLSGIRRGQSVGIFIGPEGGLEKDEVAAAREAGVQPITLGKRILRTETAGLCILSVLMFQLEE